MDKLKADLLDLIEKNYKLRIDNTELACEVEELKKELEAVKRSQALIEEPVRYVTREADLREQLETCEKNRKELLIVVNDTNWRLQNIEKENKALTMKVEEYQRKSDQINEILLPILREQKDC